MKQLTTYLQLMRPANIVTSLADILVGFAIVAFAAQQLNGNNTAHMLLLLLLLLLSTAGLYGGGVVMNDVFDAELDKIERPERPIPSGRISKMDATLLGMGLLIAGIVMAFLVTWQSGVIALLIAALALNYDAITKKYLWAGPINMALCRACNLLLGISIVAGMLSHYWLVFFVHLFYISAVTIISKGEVNGGNRNFLLIACGLYVLAIVTVLSLSLTPGFEVLRALPFLAVLAYFVFSSLQKALKTLQAMDLRRAVKFGILSLIFLDAAMAAGYAGWWYGLAMLILLPISMVLGKKFAVT